MNSKMCIRKSLLPLCVLCVKWAETGLCLWLLRTSLKCPANLACSWRLVWPTYWILQTLHVILYITLELRQEMFFIVGNFSCVYVQVIEPVLSKSGQYLQRGLSHQLKPLSFLDMNLGFGGALAVDVVAKAGVGLWVFKK